MYKNKIMFAISVVMIAVMLLAVANRLGVLEFNNKSSRDVSGESADKKSDTVQDTETTAEHIKSVEDIPRYEMGEEVLCTTFLPGEDQTMQTRGMIYVVNSVRRADRIENIPDEFNGTIAGIERDGYPTDGYTFLIVDVTIKNTGKSSLWHYINCSDIVRASDVSDNVSYLCCYDKYDNLENRSYFRITIEPEGEFHTQLFFTLKEEDAEGELYLNINPNGVTNVYDGAALVKLDLTDETAGEEG